MKKEEMKLNYRKTLLLFLCIALTGCAYAPGMNMDIESPALKEKPFKVKGYNIKPINSTLIALLHEKENDATGDSRFELPPKAEQYEYKIGPYDVLNITVWDHDDLQMAESAPAATLPGEPPGSKATGHLVDSQGMMFFPHIGAIKVAGLTVREVRELLTKRLAKEIPDPQLDVRVAAYRSKRVYVVGEVTKRGALPLGDTPLRVLDAIAAMDGIDNRDADLRNGALIREGKVYPIDFKKLYDEGDLSKNYLLQDGDVVNIPSSFNNKVYIMGEVNKPSRQYIRNRDLTLADVISKADGINEKTADTSKIFVFRLQNNEPVIYNLNAHSAEGFLLATQFQLNPLDLVYVAPTGLTRWDRLMDQLVSTARVFWGAVRIEDDIEDILNE